MAASPALATCLPRDAWVEGLAEKYGEAPVSHGLTADGTLLELFATPGGETWTLIVTDTRGVSCGLASGENWRESLPKLLSPTGLPV